MIVHAPVNFLWKLTICEWVRVQSYVPWEGLSDKTTGSFFMPTSPRFNNPIGQKSPKTTLWVFSPQYCMFLNIKDTE